MLTLVTLNRCHKKKHWDNEKKLSYQLYHLMSNMLSDTQTSLFMVYWRHTQSKLWLSFYVTNSPTMKLAVENIISAHIFSRTDRNKIKVIILMDKKKTHSSKLSDLVWNWITESSTKIYIVSYNIIILIIISKYNLKILCFFPRSAVWRHTADRGKKVEMESGSVLDNLQIQIQIQIQKFLLWTHSRKFSFGISSKKKETQLTISACNCLFHKNKITFKLILIKIYAL